MVQLGILNIQTSNLMRFIPKFTPILGIVFQILRQYWELYSKFYASTIVCGIMVQKAKADANTGESEMHPLVL
jgi:hypothetical protein